MLEEAPRRCRPRAALVKMPWSRGCYPIGSLTNRAFSDDAILGIGRVIGIPVSVHNSGSCCPFPIIAPLGL
jgi:hypothetical protein